MSSGPPSPYKPGHVLNGRYVIEEEINRGATAVVMAGRDKANQDRPVALKILDCPVHVPVRVVKREIALSSAVGGHPNLASLLDVFAASKRELVIVWEKIAGPDLLELLNETGSPLPEGRAAFLIAQLLRAVAFLHSSGFAHRDVKAENALVERATQRLRLIDFGLSKHIQSVATLGVGTPDYMAPELLQQQQHPSSTPPTNPNTTNPTTTPTAPPYDARAADAWALGVLLHLLLAGAYPFEDDKHPSSVAHTVSNVLSGRRRPLPEWVSAEAQRVVAGLLQPDPSRRTTLRELASDPWLASEAGKYAKEVPGGAALVDLSSVVAAAPSRGAGGGGAAVAAAAPAIAAAAASASVPSPSSSSQLQASSAPAAVAAKTQQQQQQQPLSSSALVVPPPPLQARPPSPPTPTPTPTPTVAAAKGGNVVQRLLASVAGVWGRK